MLLILEVNCAEMEGWGESLWGWRICRSEPTCFALKYFRALILLIFSAEIWIFFSSGCAGGASWSSNSSQSNEAAQLLTLLSEPLLHISQVQKPISTLHAHSYKKESKWWVKLVPVFIQTAGFSKGIISDLLAENQILCARIPVGLQPHSFICGGWLSIVGSVRVLAGIIQHDQRAD